MTPSGSRTGFFLVSIAFIQITIGCVCWLRGMHSVSEGPSARVAETSRQFWRFGDIQPKSFQKIYRDAAELSRHTSSKVWQDAFALGKHGELYPKHSFLVAILAAPFYGIFGEAGFWIYQQLVLFLLIFSIYRLANHWSGAQSVWPSLLGVTVLSGFFFVSYKFGYELTGAAVLLAGLLVSQRSALWGALMIICAVLVRPSHILFFAPLFLTFRKDRRKDAFIGAAAGIGIILILNNMMWGGPFLTAYDRTPVFLSGEAMLRSHQGEFSIAVLSSDWMKKLFDKEIGLLLYSPALLFLPWAVFMAFRSNLRSTLLPILAGVIVYALVIFSYSMWSTTTFGNRYLISAVALYLPCLIALFQERSAHALNTSTI